MAYTNKTKFGLDVTIISTNTEKDWYVCTMYVCVCSLKDNLTVKRSALVKLKEDHHITQKTFVHKYIP